MFNTNMQYGWICPKCAKVNAPWMQSCSCVPQYYNPNPFRWYSPYTYPYIIGDEITNPPGLNPPYTVTCSTSN